MKLHTSTTTQASPLVEIPAAAGTGYKIGQGLTVASGTASLAGASVKPEYICMSEKTGVAGDYIQAIAVIPGEIYEAQLSASGASLKVGDKVTLDADAIRVTATTASGVAKITGFATEAKDIGDAVLVKFD